MHYKFADAGIDGNYSYAGFSDKDRLALHVLYPEQQRVAEFFGTTVIKLGNNLRLWSDWQARSGNMSYIAKNYQWKLNGAVIGSGYNLNKAMFSAGNYSLEYLYTDFLGRNYHYIGEARVLPEVEFNRLIGATVVTTTLPLL